MSTTTDPQPTPAPADAGTGEGALAGLRALIGLVEDLRTRAEHIPADVLPDLIAELSRAEVVVAAAKMSAVLVAARSGAVRDSDHRNASDYAKAACTTAEVPFDAATASQIRALIREDEDPESADLVAAVSSGRLPVPALHAVADRWRQIRRDVRPEHWDRGLSGLIKLAASGASRKELDRLTDSLAQSFGKEVGDDEREQQLYESRAFTGFFNTRDGMRKATLLLDPVSAALVENTISALSIPDPSHPANTGLDPDCTCGHRHHASTDGDSGGAGEPDGHSGSAGGEAFCSCPAHPGDAGPQDDGHGHGAAVSGLDVRTAEQRRADALIALAVHGGPDAAEATREGKVRKPNTTIRVLVPLETLLEQLAAAERLRTGETPAGHTNATPGSAYTDAGDALSATTLRMMACFAGIVPVVLGGDGQPLDVGREERTVTPAQLTALTIRDGGCTFPNCTAPAAWCDAHHITAWEHLGRTDMDNLALLCRVHHTIVHRKGYSARVHTNRIGRRGRGAFVQWYRPPSQATTDVGRTTAPSQEATRDSTRAPAQATTPGVSPQMRGGAPRDSRTPLPDRAWNRARDRSGP